MQMGSLPLRYKICAFALSLVLLTWLFAGFVLIPAQQQLAELDSQLRSERNVIQVAEQFVRTHHEPVKYLKVLDDRLTSLERMLPQEARVSEFLSQSEAAAKASGVQLVSLKPGAAVNKSGYKEWPMELVIRGNYFQILNFIKKVEEGPRFNCITSIVMQSKPGQLESKLAISMYAFDAVAQAGQASGNPAK